MEHPQALADRQIARSGEVYAEDRDEIVRSRLDVIQRRLLQGDTLNAMQGLIDELRTIRGASNPKDWRDLSADTILKHAIAETLFQCPLTRRSNQKPRGYAGDAELLDHIYGLGAAAPAPHPASLAGQIYFYTVNSPACRAVRRRREIIAEEIDAIAQRTAPRKPEILSIACGHLREIELSAAAASAAIGRFVALDQDEESLAVIDASYAAHGVEARKGNVRNIISKKIAFENLDFVYAAGLFDYLADPIAMRLNERMFSFLRPGGRMLIANFTPAGPDVGYMETFMDWWLILRTEDDMRRLFGTLPKDEVASVDIFEDEAGTIVYAAVTKR
jgi:SAM-dependent methyltransferase